MHTCPIEPCDRVIRDRFLMCPGHWYAVPKRLRDAVWAAYREHGVGSSELVEAQQAAIDAVEEALGVA